jgi:hypothetical protein
LKPGLIESRSVGQEDREVQIAISGQLPVDAELVDADRCRANIDARKNARVCGPRVSFTASEGSEGLPAMLSSKSNPALAGDEREAAIAAIAAIAASLWAAPRSSFSMIILLASLD